MMLSYINFREARQPAIFPVMKAITYNEFGGIDRLALADLPDPQVEKGHLLVRVHAASINPIDGKIRRGQLKLMSGTHFPKTVGSDFAGVVTEVGAGVEGFSVGDAVYGCMDSMKHGSLCELISVPPAVLSRKPASLDFVAAAAVPIVAQAALQAMRDVAAVKPETRVLVNGCTGGVGLYALQIASQMGAQVTGVCGAAGLAIAHSFGARDVIDYRRESIGQSGQRFDVLLELSGKLPFSESHDLLEAHGIYIDIEPSPAGLVGNTLANPFRAQKHRFLMTTSKTADLDELAQGFDRGTLRTTPTTAFDLADFRDAFTLAEKGGVIGKVVVRLS
jgi:NADPH:quinone reductase-like Zn-dependent oxidoreductase